MSRPSSPQQLAGHRRYFSLLKLRFLIDHSLPTSWMEFVSRPQLASPHPAGPLFWNPLFDEIALFCLSLSANFLFDPL